MTADIIPLKGNRRTYLGNLRKRVTDYKPEEDAQCYLIRLFLRDSGVKLKRISEVMELPLADMQALANGDKRVTVQELHQIHLFLLAHIAIEYMLAS